MQPGELYGRKLMPIPLALPFNAYNTKACTSLM
jgi:hypothetical protein